MDGYIHSSSHQIPLRYFWYVGALPAVLMLLLLPLISLVSKKMGQNKTAGDKMRERAREEREEREEMMMKKPLREDAEEPEEGRAIDTQPKAEESPTSPLDRNAPTGTDV